MAIQPHVALATMANLLDADPNISKEFRMAFREAAEQRHEISRSEELVLQGCKDRDRIEDLEIALRPFVEAFAKVTNPGDSDLDNEQPYHITVTLGDLRLARRTL